MPFVRVQPHPFVCRFGERCSIGLRMPLSTDAIESRLSFLPLRCANGRSSGGADASAPVRHATEYRSPRRFCSRVAGAGHRVPWDAHFSLGPNPC